MDLEILKKKICTFRGDGGRVEEKTNVLIAGPCGTGKSHIAQALGHCAVQEGYDVIFVTLSDLVRQLHAARATNSFERRFAFYAKVPLLIIDDFAFNLQSAAMLVWSISTAVIIFVLDITSLTESELKSMVKAFRDLIKNAIASADSAGLAQKVAEAVDAAEKKQKSPPKVKK